ncbi:MAG: tetratricopeptide repeat protein, partial [Anaerolineales bacterium]|nr:tetratricopeptide repeat protein [Anaerolineales bacterium]
AIALDPNYAGAYRVLAHTYWMELPLGVTKDPRRSLARALELAQKSIALDNSSGMSHSLLGWLYTIMRQHEKGVSECELGVELEPNSAPANLFLAMVLRFSGRHEEAIAMHHQAIRLDPIPASIYYHTLSLTYSLAGRYEEAITEAKKSIRLEPNSMIPHIYLAIAYNQTGREDEARLEAKEVLRVNPKFSLEFWAKNLPFKHEADKDMVIGALRKAGLK